MSVLFKTYLELSEPKIADLDVQLIIDKHVMALDVPMDDAELVHVAVCLSDVERNLDAGLVRQLDLLPEMKHIVQAALADMLENDVDVGNLRNDAH